MPEWLRQHFSVITTIEKELQQNQKDFIKLTSHLGDSGIKNSPGIKIKQGKVPAKENMEKCHTNLQESIPAQRSLKTIRNKKVFTQNCKYSPINKKSKQISKHYPNCDR